MDAPIDTSSSVGKAAAAAAYDARLSDMQAKIFMGYVQGIPLDQLAGDVGLGLDSVHRIIQADCFQEALRGAKQYLNFETGDIEGAFRTESNASLLKLVEIRDTSPRQDLQRKCAIDILDRAGHTPIQRKMVASVIKIDAADASVISETLQQLRSASMINVTPSKDSDAGGIS